MGRQSARYSCFTRLGDANCGEMGLVDSMGPYRKPRISRRASRTISLIELFEAHDEGQGLLPILTWKARERLIGQALMSACVVRLYASLGCLEQ
jgi:hypothetical protein